MTEDKSLKELLEVWQMAQHCEEEELITSSEQMLLKEYNINMEKDWLYWLRKYDLIEER